MDVNNFANLRQERHEQGAFLGLTIQHLITIQTHIQVLVNLLQVQYQNSGSSPFETHRIIISLFIGAVCVYFLALMEIFRPIPNASYHHAARLICYISGVLACTCLVLITFPTFGWIIFSLFFMRILPNPYKQIIELSDGISVRLFNIYDSIQQYFNPNNVQAESGPQAINGNSIEQEDGSGEPTEQEEDGGI